MSYARYEDAYGPAGDYADRHADRRWRRTGHGPVYVRRGFAWGVFFFGFFLGAVIF